MARLDVAAGWKHSDDPSWPKTVWDLILSLTQAERPHGEAFAYRSIETDVLAFVMQRVSGLGLADLVSRELWQPIGAEADACFTVDPSGYALADGGFNATLRDYARFALLHLNRGRAERPADRVTDLASGHPAGSTRRFRSVISRRASERRLPQPVLDRRCREHGVYGPRRFWPVDLHRPRCRIRGRQALELAGVHRRRPHTPGIGRCPGGTFSPGGVTPPLSSQSIEAARGAAAFVEDHLAAGASARCTHPGAGGAEQGRRHPIPPGFAQTGPDLRRDREERARQPGSRRIVRLR